jgi:hypothetical protein
MAKQQLASSPNTQPEVLAQLAYKEDPALLERVAENPQTTPATLEKLSAHEAPEVRSAVAENLQTPVERIKELASDENPDVRYRLAENAKTPVEVLESLSSDENPYVGERAKHTLSVIKSMSEQADSAFLNEQFADAENLYRKLAAELEELLGPTHIEVANALHKLAASIAAQGRSDEAASTEEKAQVLKK